MKRSTFRILLATSLVFAVSACGAPLGRSPGMAGAQVTIPQRPAGSTASEAGLRQWVQQFRPTALSAGIAPATFDRSMALASYHSDIIALDRRQSEFSRPIWAYLDDAASGSRISTGREKSAQLSGTLAAIEGRYGVPREIVLAVWGMESNFGANRGSTRIIPALTTLAYDGRRGQFFGNELIAALRIIQSGDISPEGMVGSWAGAMGHTQFMPSSYLAHAVDFNGDRRRDIWSNDPTDSLASTAAYLRQAGWRPGMPWGVEVVLPANFNYALSGKNQRQAGGSWAAMGVRTANGTGMPGWSGSILVPAGARGPAFLISDNFRAILDYNTSDSYALGVSLLGDRIAGRSGVQGSWPRGDRVLSNAEKAEIQRLLTSRGFYRDEIDGKLGSKSTEAIRAFQQSVGATPDGYADARLLAQLRG
ncbi:lytic murein transglycosylase [Paracoccus sp. M683]|uniref:lytic murein transglycosylase n=1 Tax=Paracoccus sp. M683 TaxID=2594268 RepID=UPI00117C437E|nr:lytic murein transglycosylase [Paracoccus sp. M683]TRW95045.1 lytic murein transglycosylase [Paracoccus sp. M683]